MINIITFTVFVTTTTKLAINSFPMQKKPQESQELQWTHKISWISLKFFSPFRFVRIKACRIDNQSEQAGIVVIDSSDNV